VCPVQYPSGPPGVHRTVSRSAGLELVSLASSSLIGYTEAGCDDFGTSQMNEFIQGPCEVRSFTLALGDVHRYCGMSLGRVGLDFRALLPPLFEARVAGVVHTALSVTVDVLARCHPLPYPTPVQKLRIVTEGAWHGATENGP
jgi:hypothetical protein